jgi:hypothetical protein
MASPVTTLSRISEARKALTAAKSLDDVLQIRDQAEALRVYVKAAADSLEAANAAAEIKLRAERKAGEMLAAMDVPADVHSWLTDNVPQQKVELFLAGEADAQDRRPGVPDMSDSFNTWITKLILESKPLGARRV